MDDGNKVRTITGKARGVSFEQENHYEDYDFEAYSSKRYLKSVDASTTIDWAWSDDNVYTWKEEDKVKEKQKLDRSRVNVVTHNDRFTYEAHDGNELTFRVANDGRLYIHQNLDVFAIINDGDWITVDYVAE